MQQRLVCCVAGMLFAMVGFIALGQTPALGQAWGHDDRGRGNPGLDRRLAKVLAAAGFTGRVGSSLEVRLGRPLDPALADLGRLLFFDKILGLHDETPVPVAIRPPSGLATRSRWRSASTTTTSWARAATARAISVAPR